MATLMDLMKQLEESQDPDKPQEWQMVNPLEELKKKVPPANYEQFAEIFRSLNLDRNIIVPKR
jgi:hypothetical protein